MSDTKTWQEKRDEVFATLTKDERRILSAYEREHGRVHADAICKVIEDTRETFRELKGQMEKANKWKRKQGGMNHAGHIR